jgi:nicotinamide-nucleotide amidase
VSIEADAARVLDTLRARGATVATAESLTAGLVAATLAEIPGASTVLRGGLIVYASDLKTSLAGVDADLLAEHGAVHPLVAAQLAEGARVRCGADFGLGLTGVAGPDPQDGVDPGTIFIAVAAADGVNTRRHEIAGARNTIRTAAVLAAITQLAEVLETSAGD